MPRTNPRAPVRAEFRFWRDFPGVLPILYVAFACWPMMFLHGTAEWVVEGVWLVILALVGVCVWAGDQDVKP